MPGFPVVDGPRTPRLPACISSKRQAGKVDDMRQRRGLSNHWQSVTPVVSAHLQEIHMLCITVRTPHSLPARHSELSEEAADDYQMAGLTADC